MLTRDLFQTPQVRKWNRTGLLFTRDRSGTSLERIQNWTVPERFRKHLDRFQTVPCKQKLIRYRSVHDNRGTQRDPKSQQLKTIFTIISFDFILFYFIHQTLKEKIKIQYVAQYPTTYRS